MIKKLRQGQNPIQWCLSCTGMWERMSFMHRDVRAARVLRPALWARE